MSNRYFESFIGVSVITLAAFFVYYAFDKVVSLQKHPYTVSAKFNNVGSLSVGSSVIINGVTVGTVADIELVKSDYTVIVQMEIDQTIRIPLDSTVEISSVGFFNSAAIMITPTETGSYANNGDLITKTVDWTSLEDKIGNIFLTN